jgi:uroporphyrinogen-III decarboxylase
LSRRLDPADPARFPEDWVEQVAILNQRDYPLMLRVHRGFFLSMGVHKWDRFYEVMCLCTDAPDFVRAMMNLQGEFAARMTERILQDLSVDAVIFSEPIGGNSGPLISPQMYADFELSSYRPIFDVLAKFEIENIILRTYANARILLPAAVDRGFNCLWACETDRADMDYLDIRRQFGPQLRLIGGIDTDVLLQDREAIRREVERVVPLLLEQGGYVPLLDGRVREYIPFEHYRYYRELLQTVVDR